ncbi:AGAP003535-PA-like protein [Anopheles sinensis]|uniref:AGAP003535-PA-like protein n=1 Tax=Anopheles sinensis TaxID=74873 RepID=A0A084VA36_ANOSI|nr:AGAP003535-PA-like protein [Anopheles sinensis]
MSTPIVNQSLPLPSAGTGDPSITLETSMPVTESINIAKRYPDRSDNLYFLFIPLAVLVTIMLLSVMVYLMARRRHKIFSKYHYVPSFSFESSDLDEDHEERETDHLLKGGKLRLDEPRTGQDAPRYGGSTELFA